MTEQQYFYIQLCSLSLLKEYPTCFSVDVAQFIGCQFGLESNFGMSDLAIMNNNHCGMKQTHSRLSTQLSSDGSNKFGSYITFSSCLVDYVLCLVSHNITRTQTLDLGKFKVSIKGWYCPDKDYIDKINKIFNQFKSYQNGKER